MAEGDVFLGVMRAMANPPVINHSQMEGLWHCLTHIRKPENHRKPSIMLVKQLSTSHSLMVNSQPIYGELRDGGSYLVFTINQWSLLLYTQQSWDKCGDILFFFDT